MAIFSGKIQTAYYSNNDYSTIRVEWLNNDGKVKVYTLPADTGNSDYQALEKEGWNLEKLADGTEEFRRSGAAAFARIVNAEVETRVDEVMKNYNILNYQQFYRKNKDQEDNNALIQGVDHSKLWETLEEINESKEDLFAFKMWAMDSKWAEGATRDQKKALRRAQTILEGLSVLYLMQ